ncbi:hypothetical protein [Brevibacillus sp. SYSU BS000544]|uniref:hypothetical protein n=1 Tax=Brevibacillus sp. SYSU BS000544 TaxID=3416443 RepID=UPI003CE48719
MLSQNAKETQSPNKISDNNQKSSLDESTIEKQHQFQMFPTPDEKFASNVIQKLKD